MPHCIIEYSNGVEHQATPEQLIEKVQQGANYSELFEPEHIKVRAIGYQHSQTGIADKGFVHVTAKILSGRTLSQRQMLSGKILETLQSMSLKELSITVEVVEMERDSYSKHIV